jgi:3-methyl-2-oxobutanoate hydroxymethyltransferase
MSIGREGTPREGVPRKVTTRSLLRMKQAGEPITALTAYDYLMAELIDAAGIDLILVGDSAAMVIQGLDTTLSVTMEQMLYHSKVVASAVKRALVVGDLPFMSFQVNPDEALRNAGRFVKESQVEAVKLEGGEAICPTIERHLGLTPQSIHKFGTYRVRATTDEEADQLRADALALQQAGASAIVVEKVPAGLAAEITRSLEVPVIGIGAGPGCDGQILVTHDMLGIYTRFHPRFVRRYAQIGEAMREAFERYGQDVRSRDFPSEDESY